MINAKQLQEILYSHRFCPYDQVASLIESLIQALKDQDPNFNEQEFRRASDYCYNSNMELIHFDD